MFEVLLADLECSPVGGACDDRRVLEFSHGRSVFAFPSALVFRLVEEVQVVAEVVMEHPEVRADPRVQREEDFVKAVGERVTKRVHVLMVMTPRTDEALRERKDRPIGHKNPETVDEEVGREIDHRSDSDNGDRQAV